MAAASNSTMDPNSGFSPQTKIFHSLRPSISIPPYPLPRYIFSLLSSSSPSPAAALIDAATSRRIPLSHLPLLVQSLASNLRLKFNIRKNDVAFILSNNSIHIPLLQLSLLSLGAIVSPSNPLSSDSDISHQIRLTKPTIAFATSASAARVPPLREGTVLLDSPEFESLFLPSAAKFDPPEVSPDDTAAILYSSGTTGRVKGVELTHRNLIAVIAGARAIRAARASPIRAARASPPVTLCVVPFFHVYGFTMCLREVALGGSLVVAAAESRRGRRLDLDMVFGAVEEFGVTHLAVAPPVVVAMVKSAVVGKYELRSLEVVMSGGAPVASTVIERFKAKFSNISLIQVRNHKLSHVRMVRIV